MGGNEKHVYKSGQEDYLQCLSRNLLCSYCRRNRIVPLIQAERSYGDNATGSTVPDALSEFQSSVSIRYIYAGICQEDHYPSGLDSRLRRFFMQRLTNAVEEEL